eukprot:CAMPEP_0185845376 /NCGR_PEP_ID=MMETSP1354-20130828/1378_1 /TAXON_ID=708628 /ORGANISM="Erythrolobus madagascarensis, Strain CCMP3276" /LENGTH=123 /DNA_ID=CAMNT_0028545335 /DNA_START=105 /DNA_END=476 /DNA_ORIENTATION=-
MVPALKDTIREGVRLARVFSGGAGVSMRRKSNFIELARAVGNEERYRLNPAADEVARVVAALYNATARMHELRVLDGVHDEIDPRERLRVNAKRVGLAHPLFADELHSHPPRPATKDANQTKP